MFSSTCLGWGCDGFFVVLLTWFGFLLYVLTWDSLLQYWRDGCILKAIPHYIDFLTSTMIIICIALILKLIDFFSWYTEYWGRRYFQLTLGMYSSTCLGWGCDGLLVMLLTCFGFLLYVLTWDSLLQYWRDGCIVKAIPPLYRFLGQDHGHYLYRLDAETSSTSLSDVLNTGKRRHFQWTLGIFSSTCWGWGCGRLFDVLFVCLAYCYAFWLEIHFFNNDVTFVSWKLYHTI